ncbi:MAG: hypothetical protein AAF491_00780 [Verrucomicrobiota bacterium]
MIASLRFPAIFLFALALAPIPQGFAQSNDRQKFVEGLIRSFIQSRIDDSRDSSPQDLVPPLQPPAAGAPIPSNVETYRNQIQGFATDADKLTNLLTQDSNQAPVLRAYLPDLYSVRSHAHLLAQNAGRLRSLDSERDQFAALDVSWRSLSHRLNLDRSLSSPCSNAVRAIDARSSTLCELFGILPDFDRVQATILASQASAYIDSLNDVIEHELFNQPNCDILVQEGRQQVELARQLAQNMTPFSMEEAIASTEEWGNSWLVFSAKLHAYRNPRLARSVSRVRSCQKGLYDLMRIEHPIDYSYLTYLTDQCRIASNKLFGSLSVSSLSRAGLSRNAINGLFNAEASFRNQIAQFENSMKGTPQPQVVTARFLELEREWRSCSVHFDSFTGEIAQVRSSIDSQISDMREHLAVTSAFNRETLLSHAAALEGLSSTLYTNVANVGRFVPSSRVRHQLFVQSQTFLQNTRIFHSQAASYADPNSLSQTSRALVDSWRAYSETLQSLPSAGLRSDLYDSLERIRCQVDPAIAEIAILVGI